MARLYQARGASDDLDKSLLYARRATGLGFLPKSWFLRIRLEEQLNGYEQALQVYQEAIEQVSVDRGLGYLYKGYGQMLARAGKREEAILLLKEGIELLPPNAEPYVTCEQLLMEIASEEQQNDFVR